MLAELAGPGVLASGFSYTVLLGIDSLRSQNAGALFSAWIFHGHDTLPSGSRQQSACLLLLGPRLPFLPSFIYQLLILPMNLAPLLVDSASEKRDSLPHELNLRKT